MAVKYTSDVKINLTMSSLPTSGTTMIGILTSGNDSQAHKLVFSSVDDAQDKLDETSYLYDMVKKAFEVRDFNGQVEVMQAPSADVADKTTADAQPTANGANVSTQSNTTNRFVYTLMQFIDDGFNYVCADNSLSGSDIQAVSDYLYDNQSGAFIVQASTIDDLKQLSDYLTKNDPRTNDKLSNVYVIVETSDRKPAVQLCAEASQLNATIGGIDLAKIGNLSDFIPDDDLTREDLRQIKELRGSAVVDKADDMMMMDGFAIGGNYLDNFINTKIAKDRFQYRLQRALNDQKTRSYDQATIDFLYSIAKAAGTELFNDNILAEEPVIQKADMAQIENNDIENRVYKGLNIVGQISGSVEQVVIPVNFAE